MQKLSVNIKCRFGSAIDIFEKYVTDLEGYNIVTANAVDFLEALFNDNVIDNVDQFLEVDDFGIFTFTNPEIAKAFYEKYHSDFSIALIFNGNIIEDSGVF